MPPRVLVLGLGNTLRGDDALGRLAAERVRQAVDPWEVRVLDQAAPTPELAAEFAAVELLLVLDASTDGPEDRVVVRPLAPATERDALAHRLDPPGLLALAERLYGRSPAAFAVSFRGRTFEAGDARLSPEAEAAVEEMVGETLRRLRTV